MFKRSWWLAAAAAAALVACGGNDPYVPGKGDTQGAPTTKGSFTALVSFGDSLSDVGTYAPATSLTGDGKAPYFGGRFSTNSASATVWVENLATQLGLLVTPAEVGFAGVSAKCPAAANPALAATCTAYGQGGARVTDPAGIGKSGGLLAVPVKTQIANHLARFGSFKGSDLVVVLAGDNDIFVQMAVFGATAAQVQAQAAAGAITPDQAQLALFQAQTTAQTAMKLAAQELAGYVKDQIVAKGATYVAVLLALDPSITPSGNALPADARGVEAALADTFNLWLREGLNDQPVKLIDPNVLLRDAVASPSKYGLVNISVPTCDADKIKLITGGRVSDGSSLFCNATPGVVFNGMRTGADANTWLFADGVHPSTGGHKILSTYIADQLKSFGWI